MSTPWIDIVYQLRWRWSALGPLHSRMIDVRDRYNGGAIDYIVPLGSKRMEVELDALSPPIIAEAVDNLATRANEVTPSILIPQLKAGKAEGMKSREFAKLRRSWLGEFWETSRFSLIMGRSYRHLGAYASFAMAVVPDTSKGTMMPRLRNFDPLSCFPDPLANEDVTDPQNCGFITGMSAEVLLQKFGDGPGGAELKRIVNTSGSQSHIATNNMWDVALWVDSEEWVMGLMGPRQDQYGRVTTGGEGWQTSCCEFWRERHNLSRVPFIMPKRVTLDAIVSSLANLTDQSDVMAKLMRLQIAAAEKAIFPDRYVIGNSSVPMVLNDGENRWKDGRDGEINRLLDVEAVGNLPGTPDPVGERAMDRLERNMRVPTGLTPGATGDSTNGLRTGRAIDRLSSEATDSRVREMHTLAMTYLPHLNSAALEMVENHPKFRRKIYHLFSGQPGEFIRKDFDPSKHVEGVYDNKVVYSIPGAGVSEAGVALTGLVGAEILSRRTSREMHPLVKDAELEESQIAAEKLEAVMIQGLSQQLATGNMPPMMGALIEKHLSGNPEINIFEAVRLADEEIRELQAQEAEQNAPEAQPGLAPGAPVSAQPPGEEPIDPTIGPPGQLSQVRDLTNALRVSSRGPG